MSEGFERSCESSSGPLTIPIRGVRKRWRSAFDIWMLLSSGASVGACARNASSLITREGQHSTDERSREDGDEEKKNGRAFQAPDARSCLGVSVRTAQPPKFVTLTARTFQLQSKACDPILPDKVVGIS